MSLKAPTTNGNKKFATQPNLEPGSYPARVVRVYGLGEHPQSYKGEAKPPKNLIYVVYELSDAFMVDEQGNEMEDKPRWVMEKFPLHSLKSENAKSTARYLAIDPNQQYKGDWSQLVGLPVSVTIVNNPGADGRVFDNVANTTAMRPRDAAKLPDLQNEGFFFDPSEPVLEYYNQIPTFIQDEMKKALDFPNGPLAKLIGDAPAAAPKKQEKVEEPDEAEEENDDNPWD